ncbi:MAG: hypothetical protein ACTSPY_16595 [Candidatus Helarchaeota archaeon]
MDYAVGQRERKIDVVIKLKMEKSKISRTFFNGLSILYELLNKITLIEFKSGRDIIEKSIFAKIIGYLGYYCSKMDYSYSEMINNVNFIVILANKTNSIEEMIKKNYLLKSPISLNSNSDKSDMFKIPGLYKLNLEPVNVYLIIIEELPIDESNFLISLNGSKQTLINSFKKIINKEIPIILYKDYIIASYLLNYKVVGKMADLEAAIEKEFKENISAGLKSFGLKRVIDAVGLKEFIKEYGLKEFIKEYGLKELINDFGFDQIIDELGRDFILQYFKEDELKEYLEKLEKNKKH